MGALELREVKQGAQGFLGATAGVAADGTFVGLARYESEAGAQASRSRPEQTAWREEALAHLGDLQIHESTDVDLILDGGSDKRVSSR